jgi:hypothetical protein
LPYRLVYPRAGIADNIGARTRRRPSCQFAAESLFDQLGSGKGPCCSDADGTAVSNVDWETRDGQYRARLDNQRSDVPEEAVITGLKCEEPWFSRSATTHRVVFAPYVSGPEQRACFPIVGTDDTGWLVHAGLSRMRLPTIMRLLMTSGG